MTSNRCAQVNDCHASTVEDAARHLTAGNLAELSDLFLYPLAVYYEGERQVVLSESEMMETMAYYRGELREFGVEKVDVRIIECDTTAPNCCRCKVHWLYCRRDNTIAAASEHDIFLRKNAFDAKFKIELMDVRASSNQAFQKFMGVQAVALNN